MNDRMGVVAGAYDSHLVGAERARRADPGGSEGPTGIGRPSRRKCGIPRRDRFAPASPDGTGTCAWGIRQPTPSHGSATGTLLVT